MVEAVTQEALRCLLHADVGIRAAGVQAFIALCPRAVRSPGVDGEEEEEEEHEHEEEQESEGHQRRKLGDKIAGGVRHVAAFRNPERRVGVRNALVSALLGLGASPAARALKRLIHSLTMPASRRRVDKDPSAGVVEGVLAVQPQVAAVLAEAVAALAEVGRRNVPGARDAAMRAAVSVLEWSRAPVPPTLELQASGECASVSAAASLSVDDVLLLQRVSLAQSISLITHPHRPVAPKPLGGHAASSAAIWELDAGDPQLDKFRNRRALEVYTRGPWRRPARLAPDGDTVARLDAQAAGAVASTKRQDENRIEVMMAGALDPSLYPRGHPHHRKEQLGGHVDGSATFRRALAKLSALKGFHRAHKLMLRKDGGDAGKVGAGGQGRPLMFGERCALEEAALPEGRADAWRAAGERLRQAEGELAQLRRLDKQAADKEVASLETLLKRWQNKAPAGGAGGTARREEQILRRTDALQRRLEKARARAAAAADVEALQRQRSEAEKLLQDAQAAAQVAEQEASAFASKMSSISNLVLGRGKLRRDAAGREGEEEDEDDEDEELEQEQEVSAHGGQGRRMLLRGAFLVEPRGTGPEGVIDSADGKEHRDGEELRVEFVACDFGCSRGRKAQKSGDDGDLESMVRARFALDDEGCLVFGDKEGARMRAVRADPVLLDSQVVAPKSLQGLLVVARMGKCAAAAKARRARHAGAKCLVISMPPRDAPPGGQAARGGLGEGGGGRRLAPPAAGAALGDDDIDLPVFVVAREDEETLLNAAGLRACLLLSAAEDARTGPEGEAEEESGSGGAAGGQAGDGSAVKKKIVFSEEANVLEGLPATRPKGSGELLSKWSQWMAKVDRK